MSLAILQPVLSDFNEAIKWVESIVPDRAPNWRAYHFRDTLSRLAELNKDRPFSVDNLNVVPLLESWIAAHFLKDLHGNFKGRKEKIFLEKLRASTFGPRYPFQEMQDLGHKRKGSYGRDIESELIIASQIKTPENVSFDSADFTINLPSCKFGVEVKRLQNTGHIVERYIEACRQIEENPNIELGLVVFRFDRLIYHNLRSGIYLPKPLLERRKHVTYIQTSYEKVTDFCRFQTSSFRKEFVELFKAETRRYKFRKVWGFAVSLYMPFVYGEPLNLCNNGNTEIITWDIWNINRELRMQVYRELAEILGLENFNRIDNSTPLVFSQFN